MPAGPASVSIVPAADLATSVVVKTAIPICGWRNAGTSLAPSSAQTQSGHDTLDAALSDI
jgi:hypothetical protein